ncbi:hypothetical protein [Paenibacillus sp. UNC496MF]|uniref:hypothetical protein n=1 Tax=Paenibacillus sp. UNC496MF TaxID=1502753 RepID=UPI001160E002|nr:hypothetical protein [Paenibacillus sp. UNC496MF]
MRAYNKESRDEKRLAIQTLFSAHGLFGTGERNQKPACFRKPVFCLCLRRTLQSLDALQQPIREGGVDFAAFLLVDILFQLLEILRFQLAFRLILLEVVGDQTAGMRERDQFV